ncbi:hypothetical protein BGAL_0387g00090 [Botrytis galanthina]|uniref:Heterokaryon incompatibility domain-containing protein n=1 Tax=Botrytis galanthina TaxID=278940 RepID=A0A4S8QP26_9HELO|nr:hypothetical protein BGAL_0387g00090 [Botrytis galanthina]
MSRDPINWDDIKGWIEEYDSKYNLEPKRSLVLPKQFRVIDVEKDRVILAPDHCEFFALSYVWVETTSDLILCTSNVQQLADDFSISRIDIPATIKDAMIACAMIGKRYLWVDRLCIVQDESDDVKLAQIERMGDIYSSAFLTIVGACGNDARSGLAGIDGTPRTRAPWVISLNKMILVEAVFHPFRGEPEAIPKMKQASRTLDSSKASLFPTWSWSSVAGPVRLDRHFHSVPVTTWAHVSPEEGNFVVLIPPKVVERYGWHQSAHTEKFYDLEHWIDLRDYCYGTFSGEPESPTEFSLWNEDEQWTGIVQLSNYDAETVMQMCKGGNKAFFDFAAISITYIWDGPSPLHRFFDNTKATEYLHQAPFTRDDEVKLFPESKEKFFQEVRYKGYCKPRRDSIINELPVLNVMLLHWRGKVAQRVGLGQVWVRRWAQSNPRISPIVLG